MPRDTIRFVRRGAVVELSDVGPTETLLDYLRLREGTTGTKEGCREGDCGACTVAVGSLRDGTVVVEPVNSCITLLGMVDGKEVITVDDLAPPGAVMHPVQAAMAAHHASQCGFCTPGFVMSLFTLYHAARRPGAPSTRPARSIRVNRATVNDWLAGNLCRCTGYRPIAAAALEVCNDAGDDAYCRDVRRRADALARIDTGDDVLIGGADRFFAAPASLDSLCALCEREPAATIVAGATDVGLWITKQMRDLPRVVHIGRVGELHQVEEHPDAVDVGAAATYAEAGSALAAIDPDVAEVLRRLGGMQVRASGTVGGNVANGSPIGDMPPVLIALGATLDLRLGSAARRLPIEDFFIDYGRQDRRPGELLIRLRVPRLAPGELFRCYKISRRLDQDITAVLGAFKFRCDGRSISSARVAFGGMAATSRRATRAEQALRGVDLDRPATWAPALAALTGDYQPIDDLRASAQYRRDTAQALLRKALTECAGAPSDQSRVAGFRETPSPPAAVIGGLGAAGASGR